MEEEDYYKPVRVNSFYIIIISNIKVMVAAINQYYLKNT